MGLFLERGIVGRTSVLMINGEVDLATVPKLRDALVKLVADNSGEIVAVDLDGVTACDDVAFGILLGVAARAREAAGDMVVVCTDSSQLARLHRTRLDLALTIVSRISDVGAGS